MNAVRALVLAAPLLALAIHAEGRQHLNTPVAAAPQTAPINEGEIRKIDKGTNKITIRHGPLAKLDMPAMTMVFQVNDPALLERIKTGDKIKFDAERVGGAYVVTRIEAAE